MWHGTHDTTVHRSNATAIVDQWRDLHGLGTVAGTVETADGHRRQTWSDARGWVVIERYDIQGMGHGTPLDTRGSERCGIAGAHMFDVGICSTRRIASFWGLVSSAPAERKAALVGQVDTDQSRILPASEQPPAGPGAVIEGALRAAGLLR